MDLDKHSLFFAIRPAMGWLMFVSRDKNINRLPVIAGGLQKRNDKNEQKLKLTGRQKLDII